MEILIRLAGVQLGPYSEAQVRQHITDGLLSLTDLAKVDGTEEWASLAEVLATVTRESRNLPRIELAAATVALPGSRRSANTETSPLPSRTTMSVSKMAAAVRPASEPAPAAETTPALEPRLASDEPEAANEPEAQAETPRRAPSAPPGVSHLPTRVPEATKEPDVTPVTEPNTGPQERKTMLLGPTAPDTPHGVAQAAAATLTTSPLVGTVQKKTSRAALVKALAQSTSPMPTKPVTTPWRPPPATPADAPPEAPTTMLPKKSEPEPRNESSLIRSLRAKTVPMRSTPGSGSTPPLPVHAPLSTPATTTPMPTRPVNKPAAPPPGSVDQPPSKMDRMILPDSGPIAPPTPLSKEDRKKLESLQKGVMPDDEEDGTPGSRKRAPLRLVPLLIWTSALLAMAVPYYVWAPYHAAASLRSTLNSGDPGDLNAMIDFAAVRDSLKEQVKNQLGASPPANVLAMLDDSIDHYVTPDGISALVKQDGSAKPDPENVISTKVAGKLLLALNTEPAKSPGLASLGDFVIDRDVALLHLRSEFLSWKLKQVDLQAAALTPASGGASSPLLVPVVDTFLSRGDEKVKKGDWSGAIAEYTQVLSVDPHSSVAYNARGTAMQAKGDFDGAIKDFTQALALDPQNATAYCDRGSARFAKGDPDGAITDFTQAIRIEPTMAPAYDSRGDAKAFKDDLDGAIADYTQAIVIDPTRAKSYSDRGFARQANGNADGAIADYTAALALDPKAATTYYNRGLARQAEGNLEAAITDFDHALAFDPKIAYAYYFRANAKSMNHDLDGAIADYTQALALNPRIAPAYSNRGQARQTQGDLEGAAADYTAALGLDPKLATAYFNRAQIKAQQNDLDGAIADSSHAYDLDPHNGAALYTRGFAKLAKGNLDGAQADLKQFCTLASRDHDADRARIYLWLIARAQGVKSEGDPDQDLSQALESSWNSNPDDLVSKTASFLLGRTNETDYLAAAASPDAKTDQSQHCQTWYFAGVKRLLTGDKPGAIAAFHQCTATGQKDATEYMLALGELNALEPPPPPATVPAPAPATPPAPAQNP